MLRIYIPYVLIFIAALFHLLLQAPGTLVNMDAKALSPAVANFSARFLDELDKDKSVVSSPLSAEFVLALLTLGSTDPAHSELLTSLGIPDDDSIRSSFSSVSSKLKAIEGVTLNVANKVYIKDGDYDLKSQLKKDAVEVFDAEFEKVNFSDGAAAASLINNWVESKTNNKIKELLTADSVNELTRLVLVNAIYFKGNWLKQFDPRNTLDKPFHINSQTTVDVPMMYKEDNYRYGESGELNAQLLELPYVGNQASMIIVLPKEIEGLNGILKKLADGYDLMADIEKCYSTKVQVTIPKFKIETEIDLAELLPKLGIKDIFSQGCTSLSGLLDKPEQLFVSKAVQKAFIEVNEEGAEAAAATAMGIAFCMAILNEAPVPRFDADRPFLAAILVGGVPFFMATHCGSQE